MSTEEHKTKKLEPYPFDGDPKAQFEASMRATPLERLLWLEAAMKTAYERGELPRPDIREFLERRKSEADEG